MSILRTRCNRREQRGMSDSRAKVRHKHYRLNPCKVESTERFHTSGIVVQDAYQKLKSNASVSGTI